MEHITQSRTAMTLAVLGALLFALGDVLAVVAYAILSPGHVGTYTALGHGADWLRFSGAVVVLAAVAAAGWELVLQGRVSGAIEVGVAAVGTLLVAVGALIAAASTRSQTAADVVAAIGIAVWSFLVLSRAARRSLSEQNLEPGRPAQAPIWLGAAMGLLILAVGAGLPTSINNRGQSVASGVLMAVGIGILAGALLVARSDRLLLTRPIPVLLLGLGILTVAFLADAIVAGIVFGPNGTLTGLRIGVSLATAIEAAGVIVLALAAWLRLGDLVRARGGTVAPAFSAQPSFPASGPVPGSGPYPAPEEVGVPMDATVVAPAAPPGPAAAPAAAPEPPAPSDLTVTAPAAATGEPGAAAQTACPGCGAPTAPGARFCAQCGRPLV